MLRAFGNALRHAAARLRKGTVRYYCGDLPAFYAALEAASLRAVVLRWLDDVPLTADEEARYDKDVDHLIADGTSAAIGRIAARFPGPVKCDFYSVSGRSGSAYKGYPYYPPTQALRILSDAQRDARGFFCPTPEHEFKAFAYHLVYHKGHRSGLRTGTQDVQQSEASRDYAAELARLAQIVRQDLPDPLTLLSLDAYLQKIGSAMPEDLMVRWPDQHPILSTLIAARAADASSVIEQCTDLTVFLIRADAAGPAQHRQISEAVAARFAILETYPLTQDDQGRVMSQTRGGNWIEKYCNDTVPPVTALVCRNAVTPGQLPAGMTPEKIAKRYPHLSHTDVLIKRDIRDAVNAALPPGPSRVVLHATDNPHEACATLQAIYGDRLPDKLVRWRKVA